MIFIKFKAPRRFFLVVIAQLCLISSLMAQIKRDTSIIKPLPTITGWLDNEHYLIDRFSGGKRNRISLDIHTGQEKLLPDTKKDTDIFNVSVQKGDLFLETASGKKALTSTVAEEKVPMLSPDKKWVAFVRDNDLYALELVSGKEIRFTNDGSSTILNGFASWVYYEEILKRNSDYRAFWWSPDSRFLAFYRFDDSRVPVFPLFNNIGQHGQQVLTHYPKAGDPNPKVKLGIIQVPDKSITWADFDENADQYLGTPFWRPQGDAIMVQWMPRRQNILKLYRVNPVKGSKDELYSEEQKTWVDWINRIRWVKDGFLMVRDMGSWEQIYHYNWSKMKVHKLSSGKNWRMEIERIDEKQGMLYFTSNAELSTRKDFYLLDMKSKVQKRLTFGPYHHHKTLLSPNGKYLLTYYSNSTSPTRIALVNTLTGNFKVISDSKGVGFDSLEINKREIAWMETREGFRLAASIIWPSKLEKGRKYPVNIRIYGGPNYETITDRWYYDATPHVHDNDVIRIVFEHRGSGSNGKKGLEYLYGNLGKWEMEDYISWIKKLRLNPYFDEKKVMISGGSYGGYLTALSLTYGAGYFQYGVADYPVTDWLLYDTHYTERYMGLPKDNPLGYKFGSVMTHVDKYQTLDSSMLLIRHGMMDDNAHAQSTYQLIDQLQRKNKSFELMLCPTEKHGWLGPKIPFINANKDLFEEKYLFTK